MNKAAALALSLLAVAPAYAREFQCSRQRQGRCQAYECAKDDLTQIRQRALSVDGTIHERGRTLANSVETELMWVQGSPAGSGIANWNYFWGDAFILLKPGLVVVNCPNVGKIKRCAKQAKAAMAAMLEIIIRERQQVSMIMANCGTHSEDGVRRCYMPAQEAILLHDQMRQRLQNTISMAQRMAGGSCKPFLWCAQIYRTFLTNIRNMLGDMRAWQQVFTPWCARHPGPCEPVAAFPDAVKDLKDFEDAIQVWADELPPGLASATTSASTKLADAKDLLQIPSGNNSLNMFRGIETMDDGFFDLKTGLASWTSAANDACR